MNKEQQKKYQREYHRKRRLQEKPAELFQRGSVEFERSISLVAYAMSAGAKKERERILVRLIEVLNEPGITMECRSSLLDLIVELKDKK